MSKHRKHPQTDNFSSTKIIISCDHTYNRATKENMGDCAIARKLRISDLKVTWNLETWSSCSFLTGDGELSPQNVLPCE